MRRFSLRTWLLLVAVLFAALVVSGMSLTSYIVVSEGMAVVAHDTTARVARSASELSRSRAADVELAVSRMGLPLAERERVARERFTEQIPVMLQDSSLIEADIAYYDSDMRPVWSSSDRARLPALAQRRAQALREGRQVESRVEQGAALAGLFGPARLGVFVMHVPIEVPGATAGVLDVVYFPMREEAVIDRIRLPMGVLAFSAMAIIVIIMQTSMAWVLRLVDDLRKAADSVDAGRLDVRLPETGEHEIGQLARSLNRLIGRLGKRAAVQTRFVADASHELATPVAGIRGYVGILRQWACDDAEIREEAIDAIDRESQRMARLCTDLLTLVRSEEALIVKPVTFDLNAKCREVFALIATRYLHKRIDFEGPDDEVLEVFSDPDRLEDILSILLDNAGKYTPEGGRVSLKTRLSRGWVTISVSDTGIGIPAEDIPSIFERFYRSDESRAKSTGGFGLGLAIAKSTAEAIGGTIDVESELGVGTTFTLRIPRGRS